MHWARRSAVFLLGTQRVCALQSPVDMRARRIVCKSFGFIVAASATGCASGHYIYGPEENATASVSGRRAAYYKIPSEAPHGDVRVAALGIATLEPKGDDKDRTHAMLVRMVVNNNDDNTAWDIDTREQVGSLDGFGRSRPAFAWVNVGRPPIVRVRPGASVTIDLYFPLPASMQKASQIPQFEVLWHVVTPGGPVTERTSFERIYVEPPAPPPAYYAWGWWGPSWYDPYWPGNAFWGAPVLAPPYLQGPVVHVMSPRGAER